MNVTPTAALEWGDVGLFAAIGDGWLVALGLIVVAGTLIWQIALERKRNARLWAQIALTAQRRKLVIEFLHDLGEGFATGIKLDLLLQKIVQFSLNATQASAGAIFLFDDERQNLLAKVVLGPFPPPIHPESFVEERFAGKPDQLERVVRMQQIPAGEGLIGEVAATGKAILIRNGRIDHRLPRYTHPLLQSHTAIYMPMKFGEEVLGVMVVVNKVTDDGEREFDAADVFLLDSLATHGAISLNNFQLYRRQERQLLLDADMHVASEIQRMLLPDQAPEFENFELYALNHAAQHVSGDYYDFIELDDGHVGVVIADVSGKAVSGALVMATCRSVLRTQSVASLSPASVLRQVNRVLLEDLPEDMFVTLTYGVLDVAQRTFLFARAGHDPLMVYKGSERMVELHAPRGVAIGLSRREHFERVLEERRINLESGDMLVLYTDGITESLDAHEREFGRERLVKVVQESAGRSAYEISHDVIRQLDDFTGNKPPHDDRTLIVVKAL